MTIPELRGNDSYRTNFASVTVDNVTQNGLKYGEPYLYVQCPKAKVYVSGALYRYNNDQLELIQPDMVTDQKETPEVENIIRFEMKERNGQPMKSGAYCIKVRADGMNGWKDDFVIV